MLLRFQKAAVRKKYETENQAFSIRLRFLTARGSKYLLMQQRGQRRLTIGRDGSIVVCVRRFGSGATASRVEKKLLTGIGLLMEGPIQWPDHQPVAHRVCSLRAFELPYHT